MLSSFLILLCYLFIAEGRHFNGGTINWAPIYPYNNSTSVPITITQTYSWTYPYISCANNVPISTSGWGSANRNLTCVVDCSSDGGYSTKPIDILTDCTSTSTSLNMLSSTKSKNITLNAGAHFYLAYLGTAWVSLNYPTQSGLEWSIVTFIDLRMRSDGFINTPPVASVVSPQYAFVNQTIEINIPVSDVNAGDDVRCRWSTFTTGQRRRRRRSEPERQLIGQSIAQFIEKATDASQFLLIRKKRDCSGCEETCAKGCDCECNECHSSCGNNNENCEREEGCANPVSTTTTTTRRTTTTTTTTRTTTTTTTATTTTTTTVEVTTTETIGTLKSTSSYAVRQAIDECGGICYPGSVPNGTTLSNCTITFTGLRAGVWYAVAVQVEDFINSTSTTPMSSVPVQFLIYVLPQPACSKAPLILPVNGCLEVQVGVMVTFQLYAMNLCNRTVAKLTDIIISDGINGMSVSNLTNLPTDLSLSYVTLTWTPQANQVGYQEMCAIAFTSEKLRSSQYCEIFTVKNSSDVCVTTTTTSTSTTTESTTSTSQTTTTTSSTSTSVTTSSTSETTTTSSTSTSTSSTTSSTTSSSTSTSSTSTSTTSTTTSTTTSSTSTTSTTTSTTSTSTSTSTTTSTTSTSTSTTTTSATTTSVTTATTTTAVVEDDKEKPLNWLLILGLSLLALLLAICCACCCLYWCLWYPAGRRRRRRRRNSDDGRGNSAVFRRHMMHLPHRRHQPFTRLHPSNSSNNESFHNSTLRTGHSPMGDSPVNFYRKLCESPSITTDQEEPRISSTVSVKKLTQSDITNMTNIQKFDETKNTNTNSAIEHPKVNVVRLKRVPNMNETPLNTTQEDPSSATSTIPKQVSQVTVTKLPRIKSSKRPRSRAASLDNVSTVHLDVSSIEMQPISNQMNTSTVVSNP